MGVVHVPGALQEKLEPMEVDSYVLIIGSIGY